MNIRGVLLVVVAFLVGAFAAGSIGVRVIREVAAPEEATSLPAENVSTTVSAAGTYQIDPRETLLSSTALVPTTAETSDGELGISYDLVSLAPRAGVEPVEFIGSFGFLTVVENEDLDHVYPRSWIVETPQGGIQGGPANPSARAARFTVPEGFTLDAIDRIVIDEAFAPYPADIPFTLSASAPVVEVLPGVTMRLLNVSEGATTTIVQVGIDIEDPDLVALSVEGDGPGWRSAFFEAEGRPRVNLTWAAGELREPIELVARGTVMVPLEGDFEVSLEGLR